MNGGAISMAGVLIPPTPAVSIAVEGTTDWRYGARAAYSMVHDDICDYQMVGTETGWHEAEQRELPVGWGIIVSRCQRSGYKTDTGSYWDMVTEMDQGGQEVVNHSITHPNILGLSQCSACTDLTDCEAKCPSELKTVDGQLLSQDVNVLNTAAQNALDYELITSGQMIKSATNLDMGFYVYPLDVADDKMFTILQAEGYLGSRGGDRNTVEDELNSWDVDLTDPLADFRILFDAYNEEADWASHYTANGLDHMLDSYLNAAVAAGKWGLRELHSIRADCNAQGNGWGPVTLSLYQQHLDNVKARIAARQIWMGKNEDIIRYRRSRAHCGTPTLDGSNNLSFSGAADANCVKYATPVTVSLQGPADTVITNVSGSAEYLNLPDGRVLVTMDPTTQVAVTFGTGTTAVATDQPASFTDGLNAASCPINNGCAPLGDCKCDEALATSNAYNPSADTSGSGGGAMGSYASSGAISVCDISYPGGNKGISMTGGYCSFPDQQYPASGGSQWGAQMSFYDEGLAASPKIGVNAASYSGVRVCIQGEVKNAFPKTRYVAQGLYDILDSTRNPTEVQNMAWVYLITDYTAKPDDWNAGHCTDESCTHPFFAINVEAGKENCKDIKWEDFEFPYWWGDANVGFVLPEICAASGLAPSAQVCTSGEDFDPNTDEPLAHWHACKAMAEKFMYVIVAAVDDIGSDPVETVGLKAKVSFF